MSTTLWAEYLSVIGAAIFKFFAGPLTGFALGLHWLETALCSALGMMIAVVVTTYTGELIRRIMSRYRTTPPRRFSRLSRLAVKAWQRFGMMGIAILTPLLFTPIGGTVIAVAFRVPRPIIFGWMLLSALFLGGLLSYLTYQLSFIRAWFL